jgi:hypothetical protein
MKCICISVFARMTGVRHRSLNDGYAQEGTRMETKNRAGWMTILVAASVLVGVAFVAYLVLTLTGIFA